MVKYNRDRLLGGALQWHCSYSSWICARKTEGFSRCAMDRNLKRSTQHCWQTRCRLSKQCDFTDEGRDYSSYSWRDDLIGRHHRHHHVGEDALCGTLMGRHYSLGDSDGGGSGCHSGVGGAHEQGWSNEEDGWRWQGVGFGIVDGINNSGDDHSYDNHSSDGLNSNDSCSEC